MHLLDGAFLRVERAVEHLSDLQARIDAFNAKEREATAIKVEGQTVSVVGEQNPPPQMLGLIAGEVVHNLRVALDYLVYELAFLGEGAPREKTQFPIEDRPEGFSGWRKTRLEGVEDEHVGIIERYQPYKGCDWSRVLRDISNQDKHRTLHLIAGRGHARVNVGGTKAKAEAAGGESRPGARGMYYKPTFDVAFPDGTPVMATLPQLVTEVRAVLELFKPEF